MILDQYNLFKVSSEKDIKNFIKKCKILLPNTEKTTYNIVDSFNQEEMTIEGYFRTNIHFHNANSKKQLFRTFNFGICSNENNNKFLDIVKVNYPKGNDEHFIMEKYVKGYERHRILPIYHSYVGDELKLEVYKFDKLEVFYIYKLGELTHTGFIRFGMIKRFFELKSKNKCLAYLPISKETKVTLNKNLIYYALSSITFPITLYMYFQNIWLVLAVIVFSWAALAINDFINPRRHPVVNVIQAIIYAIVFAFLK